MTRKAVALGFAGAAALLIALSGGTLGIGGSASPGRPTRLIDQDFPDPDVVHTGGRYVAFATNSPAYAIQEATSADLKHWNYRGEDALPQLPSWATSGRTWAPDVSLSPGGGWVMYFVAEDTASHRQCIGVATATSVLGPYRPASDAPVVCPIAEGGAIDPQLFTDTDGIRYLVFKTDGNCCGLDTWIELAPLSADGKTIVGTPTRLIRQTLGWEGNLVEAPTLIRHGSHYVLLYSANDYSHEKYAIGVATAASLTGPYQKRARPLLSTASSRGVYLGPGGQDVVTGPRGDVLVFHSWDASYAYRAMQSLPLRWRGDAPSVTPRASG
jgi:arabinan endo-1,5-alpha-L-arabinosidase